MPTIKHQSHFCFLCLVCSHFHRNNFNVSNKSNSDNEDNSSKSSSNTSDSNANRPKSVTNSKISGTQNANGTANAATTNRNNENASVAAVTKSIFNNNNAPMNFGNTISSSTFSSPPKNLNADDIDNINNNNDDDDNTNIDSNSKDFGNTKTIATQSMNTINNAGAYNDDTSGLFCGPTTARNLFWNFTRVGDINVQPCPPGSTGIAKWRCSGTLLPTKSQKSSSNRNQNTDDINDNHMDDDPLYASNTERGYMWQPSTPDLTQCRSLWLNSLEVRVNQRDTALVSIANDLSQVNFSFSLSFAHSTS